MAEDIISVTEIQKKNELSKELKKHGFALDFSDAYSQAEQIFNKSKESPPVEFAQEEVVVVEQDEAFNELKSQIRQLERHRENSKRKEAELNAQISDLIGKMNEMVKSINMIELNQQGFRRKISDLKKKELKEPTPPKEIQETRSGTAESSEETPEQENTPDNSRKLTKPIDRTGIAPADVSVDKIFYSGS